MKTYLLLDFMDKQNVSREVLADYLGIAYNTLNLKLNSKNKAIFTIPEARKIKKILNLSNDDFLNIFFSEDVA